MKTIPVQPYTIVHDVQDICTDFAHFVAIDLEMFGQEKDRLHIPHGEFACLSIAMDNGKNYIVDDASLIGDVLHHLAHLTWIIQNATYDIRQLRRFTGINPRYIFDPLLAEKVLWGGYYNLFGLSSMARRYFGVYMEKDKYEEIRTQTIGKDTLYDYAIIDAYMTLRVAIEQMKLFKLRPDCERVYNNIDAPMIWVVLDMPPTKVDVAGWMELAKENESKGRSIEAEIGLNVFSYKKVKEVLASEYGIVLESTEDTALAEYKHVPIIEKIRDARSYRKAASTYGQGWIEKHTDESGTVYCNWNVTGAATGRQSSDNPNLQNIPARKMPRFRSLFVPRSGKFIIADVSQQEPRITAMLSKDKNLVDSFVNGEDIHLTVTKIIFEDDTIEKTDPRRKIGKEIGLGVVYGLSAVGLTAKLKEVIDDPNIEINEEKSQEYIDAYFEKFPRVKAMLDRAIQDGYKNEYVTTPYGRRSYINIHASGWENNCKNSPIQGAAADMTKVWQINLWKLCRAESLPYPVCMVIHDELVLDVPTHMVDEFVILLDAAFQETVRTVFPDSPVPFEFEYFVGDTWGEKS